MCSDWTFSPLEECLDALIDYRGKTPVKTSSGIPLITAKVIKGGRIETPTEFIALDNYDSWMRRGIPMEGDVVLTVEAPLGEVAQLGPEKVALAQRVVTLRGKKGLLDNTYLLYLLQTEEMLDQLKARATGTTVVGIKQSELRKVQLSLPPVDQQVAAARILKALDDRITLLRETNATLEAIAQALFKSWFVDFDPVRAKAEGRARQDGERSGQPRMPQASDLPRPGAEAGAAAQGQPEGAIQESMSAAEGTTAGMPEVGQRREQLPRMPKAAMDSATAALFPDSFEESELGLVPKGWTVKPVGDAVDCLGGGTPDTKEPSYWEPAEHCWTTPKDLSGLQSPVLLQTERRLSTLGLAKVSSGLLPAGTLLMSSRAPIGYLAIAQMPVAVNQGYIAIPPGGELSPVYMLFWCRQNMEGIKGRANGSTFMEISKKAFRPIPALVPPAEVLDAFESMAGPLFERLVENERQAQTLTQLRDTLLPRLISGQLRLPEAEATVEEVL